MFDLTGNKTFFISLQKSSEEFVRLFSDLIFTHQSEPLSEPEVTAALHDFTRRLDVDWPIREGSSNQQQGSIVQRYVGQRPRFTVILCH